MLPVRQRKGRGAGIKVGRVAKVTRLLIVLSLVVYNDNAKQLQDFSKLHLDYNGKESIICVVRKRQRKERRDDGAHEQESYEGA